MGRSLVSYGIHVLQKMQLESPDTKILQVIADIKNHCKFLNFGQLQFLICLVAQSDCGDVTSVWFWLGHLSRETCPPGDIKETEGCKEWERQGLHVNV